MRHPKRKVQSNVTQAGVPLRENSRQRRQSALRGVTRETQAYSFLPSAVQNLKKKDDAAATRDARAPCCRRCRVVQTRRHVAPRRYSGFAADADFAQTLTFADGGAAGTVAPNAAHRCRSPSYVDVIFYLPLLRSRMSTDPCGRTVQHQQWMPVILRP